MKRRPQQLFEQNWLAAKTGAAFSQWTAWRKAGVIKGREISGKWHYSRAELEHLRKQDPAGLTAVYHAFCGWKLDPAQAAALERVKPFGATILQKVANALPKPVRRFLEPAKPATPAGLTLEQAAQRSGLQVWEFKALAPGMAIFPNAAGLYDPETIARNFPQPSNKQQ